MTSYLSVQGAGVGGQHGISMGSVRAPSWTCSDGDQVSHAFAVIKSTWVTN